MQEPERADLTPRQIQDFIGDGFVKIEDAFSADLAARCRDELWADMGLSAADPESWTRPVVRVAFRSSPPFVEAGNALRLRRAYDRLVGAGGWVAPRGLGTFPVRFPSSEPPGDDGWHVDMSFGENHADFMEWRVNVKSRGRALLMLFLFSDVGPDDAPTKIRKGSHASIARELSPYGEAGATLRQLSANSYASTEDCEIDWRPARWAPSTFATRSWFTPRSRTGASNRASWRSRRCCRSARSIRLHHPRRFRSP